MNNVTFMSLPADQMVLGLLREAYVGQTEQLDILNRWAVVKVDSINSTGKLISQPLATDGIVGEYTGEVDFPYLKRNLGQLLPYPMSYPVEYPTTFVRLATYLQNKYGLLVENGEFTVDGNTQTTVLQNTDLIDASPDSQTGLIKLRATATSGRFVTGSFIAIHPIAVGVAFPLASIGAIDSPLDFHLLTDHF